MNNQTKMRKKTLQELNLSDDFLFAKVMENEEVCKVLLEKILNVRIKEIRFHDSQVTHDISYTSKSIRMDIYLDDEEGNVFTVEMQKVNEYNIPKRVRYYQAVNDVDEIVEDSGSPLLKVIHNRVINIKHNNVLGGVGYMKYEENLAGAEARGLAAGRARGMAEGMAQGRAENARLMLKDGVPIEKIMLYTGLSEEEINKLKNS